MDQNYLLLFNAVTDTIEQLEGMKQRLILMQQEAEEIYISKTGGEIGIENEF